MIDRSSQIKKAQEKAERLLHLADEKDRQAEKYISERVEQKRNEIQIQQNRLLQEEIQKVKAQNSVIVYVLGIYSFALTIIWLWSKGSILQTFFEWFAHRWDNLKFFGHIVQSFVFWMRDILPQNWIIAIRYLIPIILTIGIFVCAFLGIMNLYSFFKRGYWIFWQQCKTCEERRLRKGIILSNTSLSLLLGILFASWFPSWNFFSYFLLFFFVGNGGYFAYYLFDRNCYYN